jgi:hypothetical protein
MRKVLSFSILVAGILALSGVTQNAAAQEAPPFEACWGQATAVFAQMGAMGEHSSEQPTPRLGLANLARALYDQGVIPEPTMAALGAFVADALGLTIDACEI